MSADVREIKKSALPLFPSLPFLSLPLCRTGSGHPLHPLHHLDHFSVSLKLVSPCLVLSLLCTLFRIIVVIVDAGRLVCLVARLLTRRPRATPSFSDRDSPSSSTCEYISISLAKSESDRSSGCWVLLFDSVSLIASCFFLFFPPPPPPIRIHVCIWDDDVDDDDDDFLRGSSRVESLVFRDGALLLLCRAGKTRGESGKEKSYTIRVPPRQRSSSRSPRCGRRRW